MGDQELSLAELLSLCARKGKVLIVSAFVFALLLGGWQLNRQIMASRDPEFSEEEIENRYQDALTVYNREVRDINQEIIDTETAKAEKQEYMNNTLLMKIDPYNKYVTDIYLGFTDIDNEAWDQVRYSATSLDFIYSKIRSQYTVYYRSMALPTDLDVSGYSGINDKYIREILFIQNQDGGLLRICAIGNNPSKAEALADALYRAFLNMQPTAAHNSYGHSIVVLNRSTQATIDTNLEQIQKRNRDELKDYQDHIDDLKIELKNLKEPKREEGYSLSSILKKAVKYALLGAVGGVACACFIIMLWAMLENVMISSHQMERQLDLACIGTVKHKTGFFDRLADIFGAERRWENTDQAMTYAVRKLESMSEPESKILLASTLHDSKCSRTMEAMKKDLSSLGYKVDCVYDVIHDPSFMKALKDNDSIVLFESQGVSRMSNEVDVLKLTKSLDKPVKGFVLV